MLFKSSASDESNLIFLRCLFSFLCFFFFFFTFLICVLLLFQGSQDSNYSQQSSDLSLDEEGEALRRETAKQALSQLDKARVSLRVGATVNSLLTCHWALHRETAKQALSQLDKASGGYSQHTSALSLGTARRDGQTGSFTARQSWGKSAGGGYS